MTTTREMHKLDAEDKAVGRLASEVAIILRGKNKPEFEPHIDAGDIVEVINIKKLNFSGNKIEQKKYYKYSGYPGGLKTTKMSDLLEKDPGEVLRRAVREMLPPVRFRKDMMRRLIIR